MTSVIGSSASWAAGVGGFSSVARERAVDAVIDTLACMVAGAWDPVSRSLRGAVADDIGAAGAASVIGGGRSSASRAALLNGTAAHALDFDDNFRPARSHASAVLVPALIAAAERQPVKGCDFIAAYIVGLEVQAIIGRGVNDAHYVAGWHPTSTVATIGTAAGVARLFGLAASGIADAMANAVSMAAGLKGQFGTAMKPVHAGLAARGAIEAALLAEAGIGGNHDILDQPSGFRDLYGGPDAPGWTQSDTIGEQLAIETDGLMPKLYPCCGSTHYVLDMMYDLKRRHSFSATDVASVNVGVGVANFRNLTYVDPQDGMQARFSMQYCVALSLLYDNISLTDFTEDAVRRPEVRSLLPIVTMVPHDAEADRRADGALPHVVELLLRDGRSLRARRSDVRGSIREPFSEREKREKFGSCLQAGGVSAVAAGRHYDRLLGLAEDRGIESILAVLGDVGSSGQSSN